MATNPIRSGARTYAPFGPESHPSQGSAPEAQPELLVPPEPIEAEGPELQGAATEAALELEAQLGRRDGEGEGAWGSRVAAQVAALRADLTEAIRRGNPGLFVANERILDDILSVHVRREPGEDENDFMAKVQREIGRISAAMTFLSGMSKAWHDACATAVKNMV